MSFKKAKNNCIAAPAAIYTQNKLISTKHIYGFYAAAFVEANILNDIVSSTAGRRLL